MPGGLDPSDGRVDTTTSAKIKAKVTVNIRTIAIAGILVLLCVIFSATADQFVSVPNVLNIARQSAPMMVVAVMMTYVITTGGIDLSVGSTAALTGSVLAMLMAHGWAPTAAFFMVMALGLAVGLLNGFSSSYGGVPPFIATLATMSIVKGAAQRITEGYSTPIKTKSWVLSLGQGRIFGIPTPAVIAVVIAVIAWWVFTQTTFGRHVVGYGSNQEATRRSGVNTRWVGMFVYVLTGLAAAAAGVIFATRLASGSANTGDGLELQAITAVALGGTSLLGGRGSVGGTILGVLVLGVIDNGLVLLGVSPFYVKIVQGSILLASIFINHQVFSRMDSRG
jgi:simple sugar transport system permease protein